jgi:solute carrier family 41
LQDTGFWSEPHFQLLYVSAALAQVWLLLHVCSWLVPGLFAADVDPDTAAIPLLTALGDILGGVAVVAVFAAKSLLS